MPLLWGGRVGFACAGFRVRRRRLARRWTRMRIRCLRASARQSRRGTRRAERTHRAERSRRCEPMMMICARVGLAPPPIASVMPCAESRRPFRNLFRTANAQCLIYGHSRTRGRLVSIRRSQRIRAELWFSLEMGHIFSAERRGRFFVQSIDSNVKWGEMQ